MIAPARRRTTGLAGADRGSTLVEFALVAPLLIFLITGALELGYTVFVRSVLQGEMQRASRDRTLESAGSEGQRALIERRVRTMVHDIAPGADISFERKAYRSYTDRGAGHEEFNDQNGNGRCDANEVYLDANGSGTWDLDRGSAGSDGGAQDVVIYTARVRYERLPFGAMVGWGVHNGMSAATALRNQPFDQRAKPVERSCR